MHHRSLGTSPTVHPTASWIRSFTLVVLLIVLAGGQPFALSNAMANGARAVITPPEQPATGPGGRDYRFDDVTAVRVGDAPAGAWVFSPNGTSEEERQDLPVVVFLHGFGATDPALYREWMDHIARRGSMVIFPDYQVPGFFGGGQEAYLANTFAGIEQAFAHLGSIPDRAHVVGHSLGAVLTAAYGALAPAADLPPAATLTMVTPGGCRTCGNFGSFGVPLPLDLQIPAGTLVRTVVGGDDFVGDADARAIQAMLSDIPPDRKVFESITSDNHGSPPLVADHLFPQTSGTGESTDALDWYGLWRPFDALMSCADRQRDCELALGDGDDRRFMGTWSDGTPVRPPVAVT